MDLRVCDEVGKGKGPVNGSENQAPLGSKPLYDLSVSSSTCSSRFLCFWSFSLNLASASFSGGANQPSTLLKIQNITTSQYFLFFHFEVVTRKKLRLLFQSLWMVRDASQSHTHQLKCRRVLFHALFDFFHQRMITDLVQR